MNYKWIKKRAVCSILIGIALMGSACGKKEEASVSSDGAQVQEQMEAQEQPNDQDAAVQVAEEQPEIVINETIKPEDTIESEQESPAEVLPESEEEESQGAGIKLCQVVHCNEFITLRTEPSTSGAEICKIPLGSDVYYLENAENGFVKIQYNDQQGYSLASYLNFTKEDGAIFMKVYNCQESITLRKIPSTKAEEFCQIPLGEKVIFREKAENDFYMVSYHGYTGYALAEYLIEW